MLLVGNRHRMSKIYDWQPTFKLFFIYVVLFMQCYTECIASNWECALNLSCMFDLFRETACHFFVKHAVCNCGNTMLILALLMLLLPSGNPDLKTTTVVLHSATPNTHSHYWLVATWEKFCFANCANIWHSHWTKSPVSQLLAPADIGGKFCLKLMGGGDLKDCKKR